MVNILTIISLLFGSLICIGFPILLFILLRKRANKLAVPLVAGILGFFVMQIILRLPLIQITLPQYSWYTNFSPVILGLFLAFTAGLFETVGRFWTMKLFMKDDTRFSAGFAHGIGHGGIEAVLLVGLNFFIYAGFSLLINSGKYDVLLGFGGEEELLLLQDVLISTPWYEFLWGTVERVLTMIIHIGLSVIMIYGFHQKQSKYFVFVLIIHTILDFVVVVMAQSGLSIFIIELFILVVAIIMVIIIKYIYNDYKKTTNIVGNEEYND